jgi:hypothetical protein
MPDESGRGVAVLLLLLFGVIAAALFNPLSLPVGGVEWSVANFIPPSIPLIRARISGFLHLGIVRNIKYNASYATALPVEIELAVPVVLAVWVGGLLYVRWYHN